MAARFKATVGESDPANILKRYCLLCLLLTKLIDGYKIEQVNENDDVYLRCGYDLPLNGDHQIIWLKDERVIAMVVQGILSVHDTLYDQRVTQQDRDAIKIQKTTILDTGKYTCSVEMQESMVDLKVLYRNTTIVFVYGGPHMNSSHEEVHARAPGDVVQMSCVCTSWPQADVLWEQLDSERTLLRSHNASSLNDSFSWLNGDWVTAEFIRKKWTKNNSEVREQINYLRSVSADNQKLVATTVRSTLRLLAAHEYLAFYRCSCKSVRLGADTARLRVVMASKIFVVYSGAVSLAVKMNNVSRLERSSAKFECAVQNTLGFAYGRAKYFWFKDAVNITKSRGDSIIVRDNVLQIPDVRRTDAGMYTCVVDLHATVGSAVAYLDVQYYPETYAQSKTVYMQVGETSKLECPSSANPPVTVTHWYESNVKLHGQQLVKRNLLINGSDLLFLSVNHSNTGVYSCAPQSRLGIAENSAKISVIVGEMVHFGIRPETYYQRRLNESVTFPCSAFGYPAPQTSWNRALSSENGTLSPQMRVDGGNLSIDFIQLTDQGTYVCTANNSLGRIATTTELIVETNDAHAPYNVTVIAGVESANVRWMPAFDHARQLSYFMLYRKVGASWTTLPVIPDNQLRVTVYGLESNTEWELVVVAHRAHARWESEKVSFRTKGDGSQRTTVLLASSKHLNGAETTAHYVLTHAALSGPHTSAPLTSVTLDPFSETMINEQGLQPERGADTTFVPSEFDVLSSAISPPRNLTVYRSGNLVILSWLPPKGYSRVDYYIVQYRVDHSKWSYTSNINGSRHEHKFYPQLAGLYTFRVFAILFNARSAYSEEVELWIPAVQKLSEGLTIPGAAWYLIGIVIVFVIVISLTVVIVRLAINMNSDRSKQRRKKKTNRSSSKDNGKFSVTSGSNGSSPVKNGHACSNPAYANTNGQTGGETTSCQTIGFQHRSQAFLAASRCDVHGSTLPQLPYTQYQLTRQIRLENSASALSHFSQDQDDVTKNLDLNVSALYNQRNIGPGTETIVRPGRDSACKSLDRRIMKRKEDSTHPQSAEQRRRRIVTIQLPESHVHKEEKWIDSQEQPIVLLKTVQMEAAV